MRKPVFIVGLHRTGSTLLKNIIGSSDEISMAPDELHIITPWRTDMYDIYLREGNIQDDNVLKEFVSIVFEGLPYGSFWDRLKTSDINKDTFYQEVRNTERRLKDFIYVLLKLQANAERKQRFGAKYPVHFTKIDILKRWFPDSKVIHLTRDLRAICASKINDSATIDRKKKAWIFSPIVQWSTILFFISEYNKSTKVHKKYSDDRDYMLLRYEDLVSSPEETVRSICKFCEIKYDKKMIEQTGKSSSHFDEQTDRITSRGVDRWKKELSYFEKKMISLLGRKGLRAYGYRTEI